MLNQQEKFLNEKDFLSSFFSPASPSSKNLTSPILISQERLQRQLPAFLPGARFGLVDPLISRFCDTKVQIVKTALRNPFFNPEVCPGEVLWVQKILGKKDLLILDICNNNLNSTGALFLRLGLCFVREGISVFSPHFDFLQSFCRCRRVFLVWPAQCANARWSG